MTQFTSENLISRIIYLQGSQFMLNPEQDLRISLDYLPEGTTEILWIHPLDIDFNEVLSRAKTKQYERLIYESSGISGLRAVSCLPHITDVSGSKESMLEYVLLVSSIEFDVEGGASASMLAIMKTV